MLIQHISAVLILILLECVLSADNALVLAVLVKHLPRKQQRKALLYGLGGAFLFRGMAILMARKILEIWWLQGMGALYLAYLSIAHFASNGGTQFKASSGSKSPGTRFWKTVVTVELTDIAFAMDSIMVAVALTSELWVIYTGAAIGIIAIRMLASLIVRFLYRYPQIESVAYILVGWIGVKLIFSTYEMYSAANLGKPLGRHLLSPWLFWAVMVLIVMIGGWYSFRNPKISASLEADRPSPEELSQPLGGDDDASS
ncbi:MAG TPA: TerC family protein [Terriglobia bacterium]|nr:TerC family protein [Terriglobia bacterium]